MTKADFESLQVHAIVLNKTSRFSSQTQGVPEASVQQLGVDRIWLNLPPGFCAKNHSLEVELKVSQGQQEIHSLKILGRVHELEKQLDSRLRVELVVNGADHSSWSGFLDTFKKRQEEVLDFLKRARGY